MRLVAGGLGVLLLVSVLADAFATIVLPRRVSARLRLTRLFYRASWPPWRAAARLVPRRRRDAYLAVYGPLSLLALLGLWAATIVLAFGIIEWSAGSPVGGAGGPGGVAGPPDFAMDLYVSGTTFVTLGLGDVVPRSVAARALTVVEAGMGFAFLAIVIGYLPVIYQAFARREGAIALLDARAGSPPTAAELLWRHRGAGAHERLTALLVEWERWAADVLESHLSYPVLAYFRSQHYNQSWLGALTAILDTSALVITGLEGLCVKQARLTLAMGRHAVVDLAQVFGTPPRTNGPDRLGTAALERLTARLSGAGLALRDPGDAARLAELRRLYEPYVAALAAHLAVPLPPWVRDDDRPDNWQTSAWERPSTAPFGEEHF